jgi:hypothetical protein
VTTSSTAGHDRAGLEVPAVFAILVGGAVLRYWLSTAIPFDSDELEMLFESQVRNRGVRVPFIMFNGISLLMFYLVVRRSLGIAAAFAALLLVQTNLAFQDMALRINWPSVGILVGMLALAYWRHTWPPFRLGGSASLALSILAALLAVRGLYLGVTLPAQLGTIERESAGDADALYASLLACGGGEITSLDRLRDCHLAWTDGRSLSQQEALLHHAQTLEPHTFAADAESLSNRDHTGDRAIFDHAAAAFFIVADDEAETIARRVIGSPPTR